MWADIIIILFLISSLVRGREIGLVRQVASAVGFFGGLFLGSLVIEPHVVGLVHNQTGRAFVTLAATLGTALVLLVIFEYLGALAKVKLSTHAKPFNKADAYIGIIAGGLTLLITVWLVAPIVRGLPFPSVARQVHESRIVAQLDKTLPPAPDVVAGIGHLIEPNGFPQVFTGLEPKPPSSAKLPASLGNLTAAVKQDRNSVVKIAGQGCGGLVEGSGFVVSPGLVATNAHVVAGIDHPTVYDGHGRYRATPIWFDPNLDFAVLRVPHLPEKPLPLKAATVPPSTKAAVLGYPGGGNFKAGPASVIDRFIASGRNIYGQGNTERRVYELKAKIIPGNSGGPLINADGQVVGVVFAESTTYHNVGYALAMQKVVKEIHQARAQNHPVSTGTCAR
jgi:S1-C subfamily serine protease